MIELYIEGHIVDLSPDTKITLNFKSNAFGDISKIEASRSFTISLPKTPNNNMIFGTPAVVGGGSYMPYRRWKAALYVKGVSIVDAAYAVMLSVGETYEIALYWGVITALSDFKENELSLKDVSHVLQIQYGGTSWWENWGNFIATDADTGEVTSALLNAFYSSGVPSLPNISTLRSQAALLPSVRCSWLMEQIIQDNALPIDMPANLQSLLYNMAVPFTTHKTSGVFKADYIAQKYSYITRGEEALMLFYGGENSSDVSYTVEPIYSSIRLGFRQYQGATIGVNAAVDGRVTCNAHISFYAGTVIDSASLRLAHYSNGTLQKEYSVPLLGASSTKSGAISAGVDAKAGDSVIFYVRLYRQTGFDKGVASDSSVTDFYFSAQCEKDGVVDQVMGGIINTRDNLPDIKQIDFVKAICAMFGLWATNVDGTIYLVGYDDFYTEKYGSVDWSNKLIGTNDGDAAKTTFTLADVAQQNKMLYEEDETVEIDANGVLLVDNHLLERDKDFVKLPFAASDGMVVPHYKLEDGVIEEVSVKPRIMRLIYSIGDGYALNFNGLQFPQLISEYYSKWQKVMRNPIVIEEKMMLSEIDIKQLDFRKAIYLQKYGARFVIDNVTWSENEPSDVTLIKLPPTVDISTARPFTVTTGVTFGSSISLSGIEPNSEWAYLVSGAGDYAAGEVAELYFDNATAESDVGISFSAWTNAAGVVLSTDNPFVYDGSNGDMTIYANTDDIIIS